MVKDGTLNKHEKLTEQGDKLCHISFLFKKFVLNIINSDSLLLEFCS